MKDSLAFERQILTYMIIDDRFLKEVETIYDRDLVETSFVNLIADWCFEYFTQYGKSPGRHIQQLYEQWDKEHPDDEWSDIIGDFLLSMSSEYERADKSNTDYLLDKAERFFEAKNLKLLAEEILEDLETDNVADAERRVESFKKVERPSSSGINPFTDEEAIRAAFEEKSEPLFIFPDALGAMINDQLTRDAFIGIMAPEKRGKSWWLMEFAIRAAKSRCNVAFFQVGDMSEHQMIIRKHVYIAQKSNKEKYCGEFLLPILDCKYNQIDDCIREERKTHFGIVDGEGEKFPFEEVEEYEVCTSCKVKSPMNFKGAVWYEKINVEEPLDWREGLELGQRFAKRLKGRDYKLSTHPNRSINVRGLKSILDNWESKEGFIADVIVIDYADILAPEDSRKEFRHQQNETWQALRALSQERHCLVVTGTQADAASYGKKSISLSHFSEDKRKYAHVTMMVSLNQTPEEKREGIMRIGQLVVREDDFDIASKVKIIQCLRIGRPHLASYF